MRGDNDLLTVQLPPEEGRRKVNRIESPEDRRQGLSRPLENRGPGLDQNQTVEEVKDGLTAARDLGIGEALFEPKPIERPQAFDPGEATAHRPPRILHARDQARLPENGPQDHRGVDVLDQR